MIELSQLTMVNRQNELKLPPNIMNLCLNQPMIP